MRVPLAGEQVAVELKVGREAKMAVVAEKAVRVVEADEPEPVGGSAVVAAAEGARAAHRAQVGRRRRHTCTSGAAPR